MIGAIARGTRCLRLDLGCCVVDVSGTLRSQERLINGGWLMANCVIKTIHAHVSEVVEIHWHKALADVHVLIERHTAPPDEIWAARLAPAVTAPVKAE